MPTSPQPSGQRPRARLFLLAALVGLVALGLRLFFAFEGEHLAVIRSPTPGMDIDVNWNAALELRRGPSGAPNFEAMASSAPLHVWWLALLQSLLGESMFAARIVTALLSSARYVLLFFVARRVARSDWAAAAGVGLIALLPSLVYLDTVLLKSANELSLLALLVFVLSTPVSSSTRRRLAQGALLGVLLSVCFLNQLNTALYALVIPLWALAQRALSRRARLELVFPALALLGLTVLVFQTQARANSVPHGGVNLHLGFHEGADLTYRPLPDLTPYPHSHAFVARLAAEVAVGAPLTPAQADAWHLARAREYVVQHPARALSLALERSLAVFNDYEIKGGDQIGWLASRARSLGLSPVRYGFVFVLGVFGLLALARAGRLRHLAVLGGLLAAVTSANALTMVFFRLRAPTSLLLGLLAGAGLVLLVELVTGLLRGPPRERLAAGLWLLLVGGGATWVCARPILRDERAGLEAQAERNHELSLEREQGQAVLARMTAEARPPAEAPHQNGLRAKLLAQLFRHSEAFRLARATVQATPESVDANWLTLRYLMWLGRYDEARELAARLRAHDRERFAAIGSLRANRWEREAFTRFVLSDPGD